MKLAKKILVRVTVFILIPALVCAGSVWAALNYSFENIYDGTRTAFEVELDNSIPFLKYGDDLSVLLQNPDRGFRLERYMTLGTEYAYPDSLTAEDELPSPTIKGGQANMEEQLEKYKDDMPITVVQQYIYLSIYSQSSEIPESALNQLKAYFEYVRSLNMKMLLRFAYENAPGSGDGLSAVAPAQEIILGHIAQLKEWLKENEQLVADTVYCIQLGLIGFWGEGHRGSAPVTYDIPPIISALMDAIPDWMYMNLRTLGYYEKTPVQYRTRVGIHDDLLVGFYDERSTVMPDDKFKQPYYRSLFERTINDGEMAWGSYFDDKDVADGGVVTQYVYDYSLSTLSIVHNYIENGKDKNYAMLRWKSEYFDKEIFDKNKWAYNPNLLNEQGEISIFDYLRYHLGYQIVLSNLTVTSDKVGFMLSNYGFAAPFNMNSVTVKAVYKDGRVEEIPLAFVAQGFNTFGQISYTVPLNTADIQSVSVKLYNSRNSDYVRFGNKVDSENGYYKLI